MKHQRQQFQWGGTTFAPVVLLCLWCSNADAFDTGHHADLTYAVLKESGFSTDAIKACQVENWLVDYFSSSPTAASDVKRECEKLHFDNLYTLKDTTWYWHNFLLNAKAATEQAAIDNDSLEQIAIIGIVFHAAQDFYSHSNWVETHARTAGSGYRRETWTSAGPGGAVIRTGKYKPYPTPPPAGTPDHGDYSSGLNKDSHVRPKWDEAFVFAYVACQELAAAMEGWAEAKRAGFWASCKGLALSSSDRSQLASDFAAARDVSMYVSLSGADGHWKGNLSGDLSQFSTAAAKFSASTDSKFVKHFKQDKVHFAISKNLYSMPPATAAPLIPRFTTERHVLGLRVTKIEEDAVGFTEVRIDPGGNADFYAWITLDGHRQLERIIEDEKSVVNPWHALAFVGTSGNKKIEIEVWDQDIDSDDECDISASGNRKLTLQVAPNESLSGGVSGTHNSPGAKFQSKGNQNDRAIIEAYVNRTPIEP